MGVRGQIVMITGAASGIGRAQVERFLREGAQVVGVDIDHGGLAALQNAIEPADAWLPIAADLKLTMH